jgi:hypothetical protein
MEDARMSKLSRESIEKAEKILRKKQATLEDGIRGELERLLERASALSAELQGLKDTAKERRLDIEDNARAIARLSGKAKRAAQAAEAQRKAAAKAEAKGLSTKPKG